MANSSIPPFGAIALLPLDSATAKAGLQSFKDRIKKDAPNVKIQSGADEINEETRAIIWLDNSANQKDLLESTLAKHKQIGWIQLPMAGITAYAPLAQKYSDRTWTSAKGAYSRPVAEHALMLALALLRNIPLRTHATAWGPPKALSLYNTNVLILGAGGIAIELLALLAPFKVNATILRRKAEPLKKEEIPVGWKGDIQVGSLSDLDKHVVNTDAIFVTCALTPETEGCLNKTQFDKITSKQAIVVNVARGEIIRQDDLVDAVRKGKLFGAGLDVTAPEPLPEGHVLWNLELDQADSEVKDNQGGAKRANVIITPHVANTVQTLVPLFSDRIINNVQLWQKQSKGDSFEGLVDPSAGY
ncbi:NAD(P)-binding protein [Meira miltonrushii]|uniref:NAD(P)-binding protein n=1 Tax=Meira miltonrushii TaxID=1280837 RepID=A0A316V910_9BASI|nr:NAD(P)-binding protein [Meira miltonrushii]PWN32951.1 NAD(P)-binding protein [Meira miltonrushii]